MSYLVWQLIDSAFPAGTFAHSGGLEASVHHGRVTDAPGVYAFALQSLGQAGRGALPIVTAAHRSPESIADLDRLVEIFVTNPIANRASRTQGRAWLTSVARSFPDAGLDGLEACVRRERLCCHYAPVFGAVVNRLGVELIDAQRAFLFTTIRAVMGSAVRLGLVGAYEAQQVQRLLSEHIDRTIADCDVLTPADIAQTAPLIDLFQSTHDRLYSRLFQS